MVASLYYIWLIEHSQSKIGKEQRTQENIYKTLLKKSQLSNFKEKIDAF